MARLDAVQHHLLYKGMQGRFINAAVSDRDFDFEFVTYDRDLREHEDVSMGPIIITLP